jgi:hypothetical protein
MSKEDIICMAKEIAAQYSKAERFQTWTHDYMMQRLMELADLSAKAERENFCAVLRQLHDSYSLQSDSATIRARGNT